MIAYKGFNKGMTCRGFQYEEGKEYEHQGAVELCRSGFHACENPLDCFRYYAPNDSVYHQVELHGDMEANHDGSKIVASNIKIGAELDITGLVKASIEYTKERSVPEEGSSVTGDYGASSATGDYGASSATGIRGASSATGYYGASSATGDYGASSATGYYGSSYAGNETAIAIAWGFHGKAKGVLGAHIVLADWEGDEDDSDTWELKGARLFIVDGETVKADTWYTLMNGELVETE